MKYAFIHREQLPYPIRLQCRVLGVHPSGYYAWQQKQRTGTRGKRASENERLLAAIQEIHIETKACYGAPRVTAALRKRCVAWTCRTAHESQCYHGTRA